MLGLLEPFLFSDFVCFDVLGGSFVMNGTEILQ